MIFYNGASGSLGKYFEPALQKYSLRGHALTSRLEDRAGLKRELYSVKPEADAVLVQLAAMVSVPACEMDPAGAFKTNVMDTKDTVLDFVAWAESCRLRPRVIYVSTGHVYAEHSSGARIKESGQTGPRSVYALSKLRAEHILSEQAERRGFSLLIARAFGLVAPQQPPNYVLPGLIRRVKEDQLQGIPGLSYIRDYLDARDLCDDLLQLYFAGDASKPSLDVVNVCSGQGISLKEMLQEVIRELKPKEERNLIDKASEGMGRRDDISRIVGDPGKFIKITGKNPKTIPLSQTIHEACTAE